MGRKGLSKTCCKAIVNMYKNFENKHFNFTDIDINARKFINPLISHGHLFKIEKSKYFITQDGIRYSKLAIGWGEDGKYEGV